MRKYSEIAAAVAAGTDLCLMILISATTIRPRLYDLLLGCSGTPDDKATRLALRRFTAIGAGGTAVTPRALDPADPASAATCQHGTFSSQPTDAADSELLQFGHNQRAPFRWFAYPGGEIILPATAANGVGLWSISSTGTPAYEATMYHEE